MRQKQTFGGAINTQRNASTYQTLRLPAMSVNFEKKKHRRETIPSSGRWKVFHTTMDGIILLLRLNPSIWATNFGLRTIIFIKALKECSRFHRRTAYSLHCQQDRRHQRQRNKERACRTHAWTVTIVTIWRNEKKRRSWSTRPSQTRECTHANDQLWLHHPH
jgi:hypothetical protein